LCGSVIDRYLKQEDDVMELCRNPLRIQLNLNIAKYLDYDKLSNDILEVATKHNHIVILQQNKTKEKFMDVLLAKPARRLSLLQDSSGGFGREITKVNPPHDHHITGYAGGIKPENVVKIVQLIEDNNPNNRPYYIDMESGIRTDNIFSLERCRQVIKNLKISI
jgi:phosphoribosylanthranilate isomerase